MIESIGDWKRSHYSKEISSNMDGKDIIVMGWARALRGGGSLKFIQLADREGSVQITAKKGNVSDDILKKISELSREDVIAVHGNVKKNEEAPNGFEIIPIEIRILNKAEPLPMEVVTKKTPAELSTRLDARYIDLRKPEIAAIFSIKDKVSTAIRLFLEEDKFIEIHTPKIVSEATESGANVFKINYYDKEAYLAQSPQFYKQMMVAAGFDKVYEIAPAFRAEKSHTRRHVSEFISIDFEIGFINSLKDLMELTEKLIVFIYEYVKKNAQEELKILGKEIIVPKIPFPRIKMKEAYDIVKDFGVNVEPGNDLGTEGEKALGKFVIQRTDHDFVFLTEFPWGARPFYHMKKDKQWTESFDLLCKGVELITGSLREHRYDILLKQCKEKNIDPKSLAFYLNMFKYGVPPHGGTGSGLDRIVMQMLDLPSIKEVILFPRDPERLSP